MTIVKVDSTRLKNVQHILLTAFLLYFSGHIIPQVMSPYGNITTICPSAGVALGALLLWGNKVLPAVFIVGLSFAFEGYSEPDSLYQKIVLFALPLTDVLRTWLGGFLVKRYADFPNALVSYRAILLFFLWSGSLATLLPTAVYVGGIVVLEPTTQLSIIFEFLSKWLCDTTSVVIFTPLVFVVFDKTNRIWRQRTLSYGLPVLIVFISVFVTYIFAQQNERSRLKSTLRQDALMFRNELQEEFLDQLSILNRVNRAVTSDESNEALFRINAKIDLQERTDAIRISWFYPDKVRQDYLFEERFVEEKIGGVSLEYPSMEKLVNAQNVTETAVIVMGQNQYALVVPNYEKGLKTCNCLKGLAVGVFDRQMLMQKVMKRGNYQNISVKWLNKNTPSESATLIKPASSYDLVEMAQSIVVPFAQQQWYLVLMPDKAYLVNHYSWSPWQLLLGGMLLTGFISMGLLVLTGHTELVAKQVEQRTIELRRSNFKLSAREKQFRKLVQTQSAIVWRADPVTYKFIFVSAEAVSILGYPIKLWLDEKDFWQNRIHDEDRARVLKKCTEFDQNTNNQNYDQEYRMIAADGHIVWLRDIATVVVKDGIVEELYGFMIDVTRQKHNEEQLRLAANTFETQQGIMITDKHAKILRVNKSFTLITGFSPQQAIGQNPRILKSGRHDQAFYKQFWEALFTNGKFEGEIWNRRQNGEIYPEWQTVTAVKTEQGEISHFVSVFSDITEKKDAENKIHNMAFYDPLTNLPNRRLLLDRFDQEMAIARRHKHFGAVLYLDLDHFKILNDSQGHLVGDELLIQVAQRLSSVLREEDTPARLGGDEFVVLLHANAETLTDAADQALNVAEKIRELLNTPFILNQYQHQIGTSIGIALFPEEHEQPASVLQQADTAMYRSKSSGRNAISFFHSSMQEAADIRLSLEHDLRGAIDQGRFILFYHPQMNLAGQLVGAEALIRWEDKLKGRLSPAEFIPVAEESNLILTIGKWVLMEACQQIRMWEDEGWEKVPSISVNVSSRQFRQVDFVDQVKHAIDVTRIKPSSLGIELTESVMIADIQDTVDKMNSLKALGVSIAVDDFGTGYSSLVYLKKLPLDVLKIDRGFVRDILGDSSDAVIVETIINMAKNLKIQIIAEGVETEQQLDFLKQAGCSIFQGYYFDKPLTASVFANKYLNPTSPHKSEMKTLRSVSEV